MEPEPEREEKEEETEEQEIEAELSPLEAAVASVRKKHPGMGLKKVPRPFLLHVVTSTVQMVPTEGTSDTECAKQVCAEVKLLPSFEGVGMKGVREAVASMERRGEGQGS